MVLMALMALTVLTTPRVISLRILILNLSLPFSRWAFLLNGIFLKEIVRGDSPIFDSVTPVGLFADRIVDLKNCFLVKLFD